MRISVLAMGRLGRRPETELVKDYVARASSIGRTIGVSSVEVVELEARQSGKVREAAVWLDALASVDRPGRHVIACDENAAGRTSRALAQHLGGLRDQGVRRLIFLIGGADGLSNEVLSIADERLSFGLQTWPHALVRVMLVEQVYRAITLLAGTPYHRD